MIVNFFDSNISYASSFDDALEKGRCQNRIVYSKEYKKENVSVFTDTHVSNVTNYQDGTNVAWIMEPRSYIKNVYAWVESNHKLFDVVMTHDLDLIDSIDNGVYLPAMCTMIDSPSIAVQHDKSKLCSLIYSNKNQLPGHNLRFACAELVRRSLMPVDLCGSGTGTFLEKKSVGLNDYMFSITIENSRSRGYFTEKILDCFSTRTVPIYWGDSYIWNFFDIEGAILFDNIEELPEIISSLSPKKYASLLDAVERNWELCYSGYYSMDKLVVERLRETVDV